MDSVFSRSQSLLSSAWEAVAGKPFDGPMSVFDMFHSARFWAGFAGSVATVALTSHFFLLKAQNDEAYLSAYIALYGWTAFWRRVSFLCRDHVGTFLAFKSYIWFGPTIYVVLNEHWMAHIYHNETTHYLRAPEEPTHPINFHISILGSDTEERWLRHRKAMQVYFNKKQFEADGTFEKGKEIMREHYMEWCDQNEGIELCYSIVRCIVDIRWRAWFNRDLKHADDIDFDQFTRNMYTSLDLITQYKPFVGEMAEFLKTFNVRVEELAEYLHKEDGQGPAKLVGDLYKDGTFDRDDTVGAISVFLYALTPAFVAFWTSIQLYMRPHYLEEARRSDEFLRMCVKETMRLYPPIPVSLVRNCIKDDKFRGKTVKKGSIMLLSAFLFHHQSDLWVEWQEWNPHRWEENNNLIQFSTGQGDLRDRLNQMMPPKTQNEMRPSQAQFVRSDSRHALANLSVTSVDISKRFLPFGAGKHQCLGMLYGNKEAFEFVKVMINTIDLEILDHRELLHLSPENRVQFAAYGRPERDIRVKATSVDIDYDRPMQRA